MNNSLLHLENLRQISINLSYCPIEDMWISFNEKNIENLRKIKLYFVGVPIQRNRILDMSTFLARIKYLDVVIFGVGERKDKSVIREILESKFIARGLDFELR